MSISSPKNNQTLSPGDSKGSLLFMDDTSEDLENFLCTSVPECSSFRSSVDKSFADDFECKTLNSLSNNIKGKYQRNIRSVRKNNRFFKSKILEDKPSSNQNEIPVINEVIKKMFKPLTDLPDLKQSPKTALRTYSNKSRIKSTLVVESFGLPDEPLVPVVDFSKEQDAIDLSTEGNCLNSSLLDRPWKEDIQGDCFEVESDEDLRERSFSFLEKIQPFEEGSLEDEVKEGFNFEETVQNKMFWNHRKDKMKSLSEGSLLEPKIYLKPLNLDDLSLFKANQLSLDRNNKDLLFKRLNSLSRSFENVKTYSTDSLVKNGQKVKTWQKNTGSSRKSNRNTKNPVQEVENIESAESSSCTEKTSSLSCKTSNKVINGTKKQQSNSFPHPKFSQLGSRVNEIGENIKDRDKSTKCESKETDHKNVSSNNSQHLPHRLTRRSANASELFQSNSETSDKHEILHKEKVNISQRKNNKITETTLNHASPFSEDQASEKNISDKIMNSQYPKTSDIYGSSISNRTRSKSKRKIEVRSKSLPNPAKIPNFIRKENTMSTSFKGSYILEKTSAKISTGMSEKPKKKRKIIANKNEKETINIEINQNEKNECVATTRSTKCIEEIKDATEKEHRLLVQKNEIVEKIKEKEKGHFDTSEKKNLNYGNNGKSAVDNFSDQIRSKTSQKLVNSKCVSKNFNNTSGRLTIKTDNKTLGKSNTENRRKDSDNQSSAHCVMNTEMNENYTVSNTTFNGYSEKYQNINPPNSKSKEKNTKDIVNDQININNLCNKDEFVVLHYSKVIDFEKVKENKELESSHYLGTQVKDESQLPSNHTTNNKMVNIFLESKSPKRRSRRLKKEVDYEEINTSDNNLSPEPRTNGFEVLKNPRKKVENVKMVKEAVLSDKKRKLSKLISPKKNKCIPSSDEGMPKVTKDKSFPHSEKLVSPETKIFKEASHDQLITHSFVKTPSIEAISPKSPSSDLKLSNIEYPFTPLESKQSLDSVEAIEGDIYSKNLHNSMTQPFETEKDLISYRVDNVIDGEICDGINIFPISTETNSSTLISSKIGRENVKESDTEPEKIQNSEESTRRRARSKSQIRTSTMNDGKTDPTKTEIRHRNRSRAKSQTPYRKSGRLKSKSDTVDDSSVNYSTQLSNDQFSCQKTFESIKPKKMELEQNFPEAYQGNQSGRVSSLDSSKNKQYDSISRHTNLVEENSGNVYLNTGECFSNGISVERKRSLLQLADQLETLKNMVEPPESNLPTEDKKTFQGKIRLKARRNRGGNNWSERLRDKSRPRGKSKNVVNALEKEIFLSNSLIENENYSQKIEMENSAAVLLSSNFHLNCGSSKYNNVSPIDVSKDTHNMEQLKCDISNENIGNLESKKSDPHLYSSVKDGKFIPEETSLKDDTSITAKEIRVEDFEENEPEDTKFTQTFDEDIKEKRVEEIGSNKFLGFNGYDSLNFVVIDGDLSCLNQQPKQGGNVAFECTSSEEMELDVQNNIPEVPVQEKIKSSKAQEGETLKKLSEKNIDESVVCKIDINGLKQKKELQHSQDSENREVNGEKVEISSSSPSKAKVLGVQEELKGIESKDNVESFKTEEYLVGYDINRRLSFRKLLERVMELSKLEMNVSQKEMDRNQRCKSVPHDQYQSKTEMDSTKKSASADCKYQWKNRIDVTSKKNEVDRIKKKLVYDSGSIGLRSINMCEANIEPSKGERAKRLIRSKSSSTNEFHAVLRDTVQNDLTKENELVKQKEETQVEITGINSGTLKEVSNDTETESCSTLDEQKNEDKLCASVDNSKSNPVDNSDANVEKTLNIQESADVTKTKDIETHPSSFGMSLEDLEIVKMQCDKLQFAPVNTSRSISEGVKNFENVNEHSLNRPKSASARTKKMSKRDGRRLKRISMFDSDVSQGHVGTTVHSKAAKKIHYEFKVGDSIWGKIGTYPYWPCVIVMDPETSLYKKYRLLRTTPYYHVRFFGDNGKRAWTTNVIPYEGPDDLDKLAKNFWREGVQTSYIKECYLVKPTHLEKWKMAVNEAESVKNEPVETKLNFFNQPFSQPVVNKTDDKIKAYNTSDVNVNKRKKRDQSLPRVLEKNLGTNISTMSKRKNSLRDDFVTSADEDSGPESVKSFKSLPATRKRIRRSRKFAGAPVNDFDLGIELLSFPATLKRSKSNVDVSESQDVSTDTSKQLLSPTKGTYSEVSNDKGPKPESANDLTSPSTYRSVRLRSKSMSRLQKPTFLVDSSKNSVRTSLRERKSSLLFNLAFHSSKLRERKQTQTDQSDSESKTSENSATFNGNVSELSQFKKNIFRGVTKDKVCQICEQPEDVVKCRGPCNGNYHVKCVQESYYKLTKDKTKSKNVGVDSQNEQVQITTVKSKSKSVTENITLSPVNTKIPFIEQFDKKMEELMSHIQNKKIVDSTDSSSEEISSNDRSGSELKEGTVKSKSQKAKSVFKHVTADDVSIIRITDDGSVKRKSFKVEDTELLINDSVYKCPFCTSASVLPSCFVCNMTVSKKGNEMRQRCSLPKCGRYYHLECLKIWPQTQWSFILHEKRKTEAIDSFVCPRHVCHICASDNLGFSIGRCPNDKLVKCLKCPATYHNSHHCVPAGSHILTSTQIICPRHIQDTSRKPATLNTIWCFVCSEGGSLICCETCPTSVHAECLPVNLLDDDTYMCEDCESGRFPLYGEVVWVKYSSFRWWPAIILFPSEVPPRVQNTPHAKGDFVVRFFGTYDHFWVGRGRTFLYQEGDTGCLNSNKNRLDEAFIRALKEAAEVYRLKKESKSNRDKEVNNGLKPPPYVKIKVNRPVGNVRIFEGNLSNTTSCDCNPKDSHPCGPNSNCLNRILWTECNPESCPAGQRCENQRFEKREYPQLIPYRTAGRGWGLKNLEDIKKGQFLIEYVGEVIDDEEFQRRMKRMHQQKDENFYFLTIDKDRMLDAGPKGNMARFMNHSCQPNCETQKWTVNGDTRVGLFALENIPVNSELTFNYNLECAGTEKKICRCGAPKCSGFIGAKPEEQRPVKRIETTKKKDEKIPEEETSNESCFICGKGGSVRKCTHQLCHKSYHQRCVQLKSWPDDKWVCPSHRCNTCSKRSTRCCVLCTNSFCARHFDGNIRCDSVMGYVCCRHDPTKKNRGRRRAANKQRLVSSSQNKPLKKSSRDRKRVSSEDSTISPEKEKREKRKRGRKDEERIRSKKLRLESK